jgi:hypothetical protein
MTKLILLCIVAVLFSCNGNKEKDKLIEEMSKNILYSNSVIYASTQNIYSSFEVKKYDRHYKEGVSKWLPILTEIERLCKIFYNLIGENNAAIHWGELEIAFKSVKDSILKLNPEIEQELRLSFNNMKILNDTTIDINKLSISNQKNVLSKLKNTIAIIENKAVAFCHSKIDQVILICLRPQVLVTQNKSHFKNGEILEIIGGVGIYANDVESKMVIQGKEYDAGNDGFANYSIKLNKKPGKYALPVQVNFIDQNGIRQIMTKNFEYYIDN